MTVIPDATAERLRAFQRRHDAREGTAVCRGCGEAVPCPPWHAAEAIIAAHVAQRDAARALNPARRRTPTRPPARGRAPVSPAARLAPPGGDTRALSLPSPGAGP